MPAIFEVLVPEDDPVAMRRETWALQSILERNRDLTVSNAPDAPIRPGERGEAAAETTRRLRTTLLGET